MNGALLKQGLENEIKTTKQAKDESTAKSASTAQALAQAEQDLAIEKSGLAAYEAYLSKFRGCDVNILELGVQSGGSQEMWLDYFGPRAHAYGADLRQTK